jgi:hypothetical protein
VRMVVNHTLPNPVSDEGHETSREPLAKFVESTLRLSVRATPVSSQTAAASLPAVSFGAEEPEKGLSEWALRSAPHFHFA